MMISTRGRYALRVMIDLAEHKTDGYIPMKEVAARQEISLKYLERILPVLVKNGLVERVQGKGGYKLSRFPEECTVGEILRLTEGNLAPVACLDCNDEVCEKKDTCKTLSMWTEFHRLTNRYFDDITIAELANGKSL